MLRTLRVGFLLRAALAALSFLACFSFASAKDEMTSSLVIGNARIDILIERTYLQVPVKDILLWVKSAAECVTTYYRRFAVPRVLIRITPFDGRGVRNGMTFGERGGRITIRVGDKTSRSELASDWMLIHEMGHRAFPSVDDQHHWIEEGIATYVEPIARIQARHLKAEQMWLDLVRDMPQGLPPPGDRGLDHTHTWGRPYGGGFLSFQLSSSIRRPNRGLAWIGMAKRPRLASEGMNWQSRLGNCDATSTSTGHLEAAPGFSPIQMWQLPAGIRERAARTLGLPR